jgi:hypothetical protein
MTQDENTKKPQKFADGLNYYVIAGIFTFIFFYQRGNYLQPQINSQLDFFELTYILAWAAPSVFSFIVARRYWGSKIFGRAYLALGLAYACNAIGETLFNFYQIKGIANPYPYYPDIFFSSFYLFALYHLRTNTHYFKPKLERRQKLTLIIIPCITTLIYIFVLLVPVTVQGSIPDLLSHQITVGETSYSLIPSTGSNSAAGHLVVGNSTFDLIPINATGTNYPQIYDKKVLFNLIPISLSHLTLGQIQKHDQTFYNGFYAGVFYVAATSLVAAWALVGFQVFRGTVLGSAWGLLLIGLALNTVADVLYYYSSIYYWDRASISTSLWVVGGIIVTYSLYKHRKAL